MPSSTGVTPSTALPFLSTKTRIIEPTFTGSTPTSVAQAATSCLAMADTSRPWLFLPKTGITTLAVKTHRSFLVAGSSSTPRAKKPENGILTSLATKQPLASIAALANGLGVVGLATKAMGSRMSSFAPSDVVRGVAWVACPAHLAARVGKSRTWPETQIPAPLTWGHDWGHVFGPRSCFGGGSVSRARSRLVSACVPPSCLGVGSFSSTESHPSPSAIRAARTMTRISMLDVVRMVPPFVWSAPVTCARTTALITASDLYRSRATAAAVRLGGRRGSVAGSRPPACAPGRVDPCGS